MTEWMTLHGYTTYSEVEQHYARQLIGIIQTIGNTKYVIWQDPVDKNVTVKTIVVENEILSNNSNISK
jgi:hypothetical protein